MAGEITTPHNNLFRSVFGDTAEASALLRAHLPQAISRQLPWSTLSEHGDIVTLYEYGGTDFLLCTRSSAAEIRDQPLTVPAYLCTLTFAFRVSLTTWGLVRPLLKAPTNQLPL